MNTYFHGSIFLERTDAPRVERAGHGVNYPYLLKLGTSFVHLTGDQVARLQQSLEDLDDA